MQYLVTGTYNEPGPLLPPEKVVEMVENVVVPSLEIISQMQKDGKMLAGGIHAGSRVGTMIVEAASNEEVDQMIGKIPFWGLLRWTITPLVSFSDRAKWEAEGVKEMKKRLAG